MNTRGIFTYTFTKRPFGLDSEQFCLGAAQPAIPEYQLNLNWEYSMTWHDAKSGQQKVLHYDPDRWNPTDPRAPWSILSATTNYLGYSVLIQEALPKEFNPDKVLVFDGKQRRRITTRPQGSKVIRAKEGSKVTIKVTSFIITNNMSIVLLSLLVD